MTVDLDLHPQGVLEVQQNATAAVVCKVQHDGGQRVFTVFTWDGELLLVGHRHFNSGLLSTSFRNCSVTDEGRICEEFTLTIKAVSAANGSIVSCFSTNMSTQFSADGHVEILVTDSISGVCAYACSYVNVRLLLCFQCHTAAWAQHTNSLPATKLCFIHDLPVLTQLPVLNLHHHTL